MSCFYLADLKIPSLSLIFESLVMMHRSVNLFKFILLRICWTSWLYGLLFIKCVKLSSIISSNILFASCSPLFLVLSLCTCMWWYAWWFFTGFWCFIPFSFCSSDWIMSVDLSSSLYSFFLLPAQMCFWGLLMKFSFQLVCFSLSCFSICLIFIIPNFSLIFAFVRHYLHTFLLLLRHDSFSDLRLHQ